MTESTEPTVGWQAPDPQDPLGPAPGLEFAPHGARLLAYLADSAIIIVVSVVLLLLIGVVFLGGVSPAADRSSVVIAREAVIATLLLFVLFLVPLLLYFPFFWARGGQTPGMWIFGLRVVRDKDGRRIGWGTALLRTLGMYVASAVFYLGFIWILVDKRRRGFHDLIAGTVVVRRV